jgi:ribose transport system permease protein
MATGERARERWRLPAAAADALGLLAVLAGLVLLFGLTGKNFLTARTLFGVLNQLPDLLVVAAGMTLVLVVGGIDLSVGSVAALAGAVFGLAVAGWGLPVWAAGPLAPLAGLLCGLMIGGVTVGGRVPSFIVTLGMLEVARGGCYLLTGSQTQYLGPAVGWLGDPVRGLGVSPAFLVAMAVVLAAQVALARTVWGRHAVGWGRTRRRSSWPASTRGR